MRRSGDGGFDDEIGRTRGPASEEGTARSGSLPGLHLGVSCERESRRCGLGRSASWWPVLSTDEPRSRDVVGRASSGPSAGLSPTLLLRGRLRECADWTRTGPLTVLLQRFFASVGGIGGSRGWSLGCVGENPRDSFFAAGSGGGRGVKDGEKVMNGEVIALKALNTVISGSSLLAEGGKGYSKRGETSNGVPTIDEGECSDKFARLSRGLSDMGCSGTLSANESA